MRFNRLSKFFHAALLALILPAMAPAEQRPDLALPEIGDPASVTLSPAQERELGKAFLRSIRRHLKIIEDPALNAYIQNLGNRLVANSDGSNREFTFFIVEAADVNAFAGPGGMIGIHTGLILASRSESELASVMAHEIAHVTQRHLARAIDAASRMQGPAAAAMLAAILLGSQSADLGQAALVGVTAASAQSQINFTRANEEEADRIGMQTLDASGFDPEGMPGFFERLQQANQYASGAQIPEFLRTHPVTISRISDSRNRAAQLGAREVHDSLDYLLARANIKVRSMPADQALNRFEAPGKKETAQEREVRHYGLALTLSRMELNDRAARELDALLAARPDEPVYLLALSDVLFQAGRADKVLELLKPAVANYPGNEGLLSWYCRALIERGQAKKASQMLNDYTRHNRPSAQIYKLMSQAAQAAGSQVESHLYLGEAYYERGYTSEAIRQLEIGLDLPGGNYYQTERMNARLAEWRQEVSED